MIRLLLIAIALALALMSAAAAEPLTVFSYGEFYPTKASAERLDFTCSRFALPVNGFIADAAEKCRPLRSSDVNFAADYILDHKYRTTADEAMWLADEIVLGWEQATEEYDADVPLELLLAVYRYESGFDWTARNIHSGAFGLPQLMPQFHKWRLEEAMGLDWHSPADQTFYTVWHVDADMDKGQSLRKASSWWTVVTKGRAWPEYLRLLEVRKDA